MLVDVLLVLDNFMVEFSYGEVLLHRNAGIVTACCTDSLNGDVVAGDVVPDEHLENRQ